MWFNLLHRHLYRFFADHDKVVVAEWLRRWTRNPLGFPRAGSNPADYDKLMSILVLRREECFLSITWKWVKNRALSLSPFGNLLIGGRWFLEAPGFSTLLFLTGGRFLYMSLLFSLDPQPRIFSGMVFPRVGYLLWELYFLSFAVERFSGIRCVPWTSCSA